MLKVITPGQTSIEQHLSQQNIRVYPNPFRDGLVISGLAAYDKPELEMLDAVGRKISFSSHQEGNDYRITMEKDSPPGLLMLTIRTAEGIVVYKLYKE